jgi:hypothetical protein
VGGVAGEVEGGGGEEEGEQGDEGQAHVVDYGKTPNY